jgi:tetratricopeptide (TPR) repeat protein
MAARLDLARFYLARDMHPEAKAVLDVVLADNKASHGDAIALVLRAVANIMLNRPAAALNDLSAPLIGKQYDASVWRAVARADQGHWSDARDGFRDAQVMVASLPVELQRFALRKLARSSIELKDFAGAQRQLSEFETIGVPAALEPTMAVLNGRVAEGLGQSGEALRQYSLAVESNDRVAAAQGRLRELVIRYAKSEIPRDDMIAALETLTAVWRGDDTESEGQLLLAQLYTQDSRYRDAFRVMRAALLAHPNSATTRQIHDDAAATFESLFLAGGSEAMPPVEALGLFYDFRELTPIGRRGDEMIRRLAERLAAVDLLDQAAELLQHQVDHRLQGAARAQVATRLAVIYLMNRKPDRALTALRTSRTGDLANELRAQRLLLEARALADLGRGPLALEVIEKQTTREATRLRADILWQAKDWNRAAEQFEKLYGSRWKDFNPLTALERPDIMRAAVGYALADDMIGLARLRERYAAKMADGPDRAAFDLVTGPAGAANAQFAKIASAVGSYDALDGLLRVMRERFPETGAVSRPASLASDRQAALPPRARVAETTGSLARR